LVCKKTKLSLVLDHDYYIMGANKNQGGFLCFLHFFTIIKPETGPILLIFFEIADFL